jgi:predicted phosphodiesterase
MLCISDTHLENKIYNGINHKYPKVDCYIYCGGSPLIKKDPLLSKYNIVKGNHDEETFLHTHIPSMVCIDVF